MPTDRMPFITDHGQQIYYREERPSRRVATESAGVPRTLVFIPGDTASSACLTGELRYFGHRYHALALDPPGTGRSLRLSTWPADWWHLTATAAAALTEQLALAPAVVIGSSDGGLVALLLALEHPHLVCGVVADSCPPVFSASDMVEAAAARRRVLSASRADAASGSLADHTTGPWRLRMRRWSRAWFWQRAHGSDWRSVVAADADLRERAACEGDLDLFGERLARLHCPVLFSGSLDDDVFTDLGPRLEEAADRMPDAQVFLWPGGGHPLMWTAPTAFRRAVDDFLTDIAGGAGQGTAADTLGAADLR